MRTSRVGPPYTVAAALPLVLLLILAPRPAVSAPALDPPEVNVAPTSLSAILHSGAQETQTLTLSNTGAEELEFSISAAWWSQPVTMTALDADPSPRTPHNQGNVFALPSRGSGTVPAFGSLDVEIQFTTLYYPADHYTGWLEIHTNDPATPLLSVPTSLTITEAPHIQIAGETVLRQSSVAYDTAGAVTSHQLNSAGAPVMSGTVTLIATGHYADDSGTTSMSGEGLEFLTTGQLETDCATITTSRSIGISQLAGMAVDDLFSFVVENSLEVEPICPENRHTVLLRYQPERTRLDFAAEGQTLRLRIQNTGSQQLTVSAINIDTTEFHTPLETVTVPPYNYVELPLTFVPIAGAAHAGVLELLSDDPDRPVTQIQLGGSCDDDDGDGVASCDGDCDDANPFCATNCIDADSDGFCITHDCDDFEFHCALDCTDADADAVYACAGDCDDANDLVFPGAIPICDGVNNDCNDPDWPALAGTNEADDDLDGASECDGDCDDAAQSVYPGAPQLCDGLNNDCNAENWPDLGNTNEYDNDLDGLSECAGDCDGQDSAVYPGADQVCDGVNNDCNDPDWPALAGTNDGDDDSDGVSECDGDCDDAAQSVYPGAPQLCDGLNNDCNAENWPDLGNTNETDNDLDGLAECAGDCDGEDPTVYPGADQVCDGVNNDCDDPTWPQLPAAEADADSDGVMECQGDCDDTRGDVFPGAIEVCDGHDNDCNTLIDEDDLGEDVDGDGIFNLCDNCRELFNPSQADSDTDNFGDLCDNCMTVSNSTQADFDEDLEGDACDLDDGFIVVSFQTKSTVQWQEEAGYLSWNVYQGSLELLRTTGEYTQLPLPPNELADRECGSMNTSWQLTGAPSSGQVAFYLATGNDISGEGSLGTDSAGEVRFNSHPCP